MPQENIITTRSTFTFGATGNAPMNRSYSFNLEEKNLTAARQQLINDLRKIVADLESMEIEPEGLVLG